MPGKSYGIVVGCSLHLAAVRQRVEPLHKHCMVAEQLLDGSFFVCLIRLLMERLYYLLPLYTPRIIPFVFRTSERTRLLLLHSMLRDKAHGTPRAECCPGNCRRHVHGITLLCHTKSSFADTPWCQPEPSPCLRNACTFLCCCPRVSTIKCSDGERGVGGQGGRGGGTDGRSPTFSR